MNTEKSVLLLWKNGSHPYYIPNLTLKKVFRIVISVTGNPDRAQPISEGQLAEICRKAEKEGVRVKTLPRYDREVLGHLAMLGECEPPPPQWA